MAKREPKPLIPLKSDFVLSLDRFVHEAGMLADAVETALKLGAVQGSVAKMLSERVAIFKKARFGGE